MPWYCHLLQVTVSKTCLAAAVAAEFTICSTVPLFMFSFFNFMRVFQSVSKSFSCCFFLRHGLCMEFFKIWLQCLLKSCWLQSSTVPMFAPKLHCSNVWLQYISNIFSSAFSHRLGVLLCSKIFEVQYSGVVAVNGGQGLLNLWQGSTKFLNFSFFSLEKVLENVGKIQD